MSIIDICTSVLHLCTSPLYYTSNLLRYNEAYNSDSRILPSFEDAVTLEGYYEDKVNQANSYWLVRNSWGTWW